jgi:hypothetical protein
MYIPRAIHILTYKCRYLSLINWKPFRPSFWKRSSECKKDFSGKILNGHFQLNWLKFFVQKKNMFGHSPPYIGQFFIKLYSRCEICTYGWTKKNHSNMYILSSLRIFGLHFKTLFCKLFICRFGLGFVWLFIGENSLINTLNCFG